jgi:hypothetical protein
MVVKNRAKHFEHPKALPIQGIINYMEKDRLLQHLTVVPFDSAFAFRTKTGGERGIRTPGPRCEQ